SAVIGVPAKVTLASGLGPEPPQYRYAAWMVEPAGMPDRVAVSLESTAQALPSVDCARSEPPGTTEQGWPAKVPRGVVLLNAARAGCAMPRQASTSDHRTIASQPRAPRGGAAKSDGWMPDRVTCVSSSARTGRLRASEPERLLVELHPEHQVGTFGSVMRRLEVAVAEAAQVEADADPGVLERGEADARAERPGEAVLAPGVQHTGAKADVHGRREVEARLGPEQVAVAGVVVRAEAVQDVAGAVVEGQLAALLQVEHATGIVFRLPCTRRVVEDEVVDDPRRTQLPGGRAVARAQFVEAEFELVEHRPRAAGRTVAPRELRIRQQAGTAVGVALRERLHAGGHRHAVAYLAQERGREAVAVVVVALARLGAGVPHPQRVAIGGTAGQRHEILGQGAAVADAAGLDRLRRIHHQRRVAGAIEGLAGIERQVQAPVLGEHEVLVEAEQGEGARAVFADLALGERGAQRRVLPRLRFEADPGGGSAAVLAIGEFLRGQDAEAVGDRVRGVQLQPGREIDAVVLPADAEIALDAELQATIQQEAAGAQRDLLRLFLAAVGAAVARPQQAGRRGPVLVAIRQFRAGGLAGVAARQLFQPVGLALQ